MILRACKIGLFLLVVVFIGISCSGKRQKREIEQQIAEHGYPQIKFDTTYYDFGTLVQGEEAAYTFRFENTGKADLVIYDAFSTCGCTVPDYSKKPVSPGENGKIEVVFNSSGKFGLQYKTVTLKLNTEMKQKTLTIKANVVVKNV